MKRTALSAVVTLLTAGALVLAAPAGADLADETALAERFAPVVRVVEQARECEYGEKYGPVDVDIVFDEPTVALRGPWTTADLVEIGPSAADLANRFDYHLDFPGNALEPKCDYERWVRRIGADTEPAIYAHVVTDPDHPGQVALQYWLFYVFNEFNNLHEGDWEMIQLNFDAPDAAAALATTPVSVGYSSHEGAERADWGEDKLELVDETHPVVYPAAGSHANKFTEALYIGSSAEAGVGCDDTRGPHSELRPAVKTIPSDPAAAAAAFPWIVFEGRWGELQPAFFNGPTGPNLKSQWTAPITWSEEWRDRSYAVPTGGLFGTSATDFFCSAVETGSKALISLLRSPATTILFLAALLASRSSRSPGRSGGPPFPCGSRAAGRGARSSPLRPHVRDARAARSSGSAAMLIPLSSSISIVQASCSAGSGCRRRHDRRGAGALVLLVVAIGHHADAARARVRPGGDRVRARASSTAAARRPGRRVPAGVRSDGARARGSGRGRRLDGAVRDGRLGTRCDLARRALVAARARCRRWRSARPSPASAGAPSSCAAAGSASRRSSASGPCSRSPPARSWARS